MVAVAYLLAAAEDTVPDQPPQPMTAWEMILCSSYF